VTFRDRLTGRLSPSPQGLGLPGQWQWVGRASETVASASLAPGALLFPDAQGRLSGADGLKSEVAWVPGAFALRTLTVVASELAGCDTVGAWLDKAALMAPEAGLKDETPLERTLRTLLPLVEGAFAKPATHLRRDEERQPVSRCRRPSPRAVSELSRRTEDWAGQRLFGIEPKRVLGLVQEEDLDTYENRVAVRLVDHLVQALRDLLEGVEYVIYAADALDKWTHRRDPRHAEWRRADRIYRIFWKVWHDPKAPKLLDAIRERREALTALRGRVRALSGTRLYRSLAHRHREMQLRRTNLFAHDARYRAIFDLWLAWEARQALVDEGPAARLRIEQRGGHGFADFTLRVVLQACRDLDLLPADHASTPLRRRGTVPLNGRLGAEQLDVDLDEGLIRLHSAGPASGLDIRMVPAQLQGIRDFAGLTDALGPPPPTPTVVTYLGGHDLAHLGAVDPSLLGPGPRYHDRAWVPIAPWEVESAELLARAIRWYLSHPRFEQYPPRLTDLPRDLPPLPEVALIDGRPALLSLPRGPWDALDSALAAERKPSPRRPDSASDTQLGRLAQSFGRARALLLDLGRCPVCRPGLQGHFEGDATHSVFKAQCPACGTAWGSRPCADCGARFPWLRPRDARGSTSPEAITATYGADILAFPRDADTFRCTRCDGAGPRGPGAATPATRAATPVPRTRRAQG
jgi:hypothetical protein